GRTINIPAECIREFPVNVIPAIAPHFYIHCEKYIKHSAILLESRISSVSLASREMKNLVQNKRPRMTRPEGYSTHVQVGSRAATTSSHSVGAVVGATS